MMEERINRENYEGFALDYLEGNLDENTMLAFEAFLARDPNLAHEIRAMKENMPVVGEMAASPSFSHLKKEIRPMGGINGGNYEEKFIEAIENGNLVSAEEFVRQNPFLQQDWALYQKSVLVPDKKMVFERKGALKKPLPLFVLPRGTASWSAAAAVAILLGIALTRTESQRYVERVPGDEAFEKTLTSRDGSGETSDSKTIEGQTIITAGQKGTVTSYAVRENLKEMTLKPASLRVPVARDVLLDDRTTEAGSLAVHEWVEPQNDPLNGRTLTVTQFLAESLTGKETENNVDAGKTVLASSINKLGEITGVEISPGKLGNSEKTIHIVAGAFEFKHTLGKNN